MQELTGIAANRTEEKDTSRTPEDIAVSLYSKREKIYPREVHGKFAILRILSVFGLLGIFYGLPWIEWYGRQAVLLDLPTRKFYIFGLTLWPQDFLYLTFLLLIAALSLFFFTALAGRLWCGYACPQTVWTEVFLWIERKFEGSRLNQMKLDKAPMSWRKFRIKAGKHAVWILFSAYTGFTFVAYFTPARELASAVINFQTGPWETFWIIFYGFATYGNAGWMREQVCLYMCPYARFQSAMFDDDTLIISYDEKRGEPRGARSVGTDHHRAGLGDCINCTLCVQACPTGIDIRDGLQYECIGCSACIDVCNNVMDKMNYPRGLIRYTTQNALQGKKSRIIRPRILVYGFITLLIFGVLAYSLSQRIPLDMDIIRDRNQLYRETQGQIENVYTFKIMNMDETDHIYEITAKGIPGLSLIFDDLPVSTRSGEVKDVVVKARADEADLESRSSEVIFTIQAVADENLKVSKEAKFIGPLP